MPLKIKDKWVFWYSPRGKKAKSDAANYVDNLTKLGEFQSIEDFFSYYCFLKRPSEIDVDNKLILFRSGYMPMWEECLEGGCWIIQFKKRQLQELNKRWESIIIACISEEFEATNVLGVVLSKRSKRNLIELWVKNRDEDMKIKIGEKLRFIMEMDPQNLTFYFKEHSKSFQEKSTLRGAECYTFIQTPLETPVQTPNQPANIIDSKQMNEKLENFKLN